MKFLSKKCSRKKKERTYILLLGLLFFTALILPKNQKPEVLPSFIQIQQENTYKEDQENNAKIPILRLRLLDESKNPLSNISVAIHPISPIAITDINGFVLFTDIPVGIHTITYSKDNTQYSNKIILNKEKIQDIEIVVEIDLDINSKDL